MKEIISKFVVGGIDEVNGYMFGLQQNYTVYQAIRLEKDYTLAGWGYLVQLLVEKK